VQPTSASSFRRVSAGESVEATWDVTAPTTGQLAKLTAVARYDYGGRASTSARRAVSVIGPPAGSPYMSDLAWVAATSGFGPVERDTSNGERPADDGNPITIGGRTYEKGLGVHAHSRISYYLGRNCSLFTSDVGVDDEVGDGGSVVFEVWAGDQRVYQSDVLTGRDGPVAVSVDVSGAETIHLVVDDARDGAFFDHAHWAGARLSCAEPGPAP
jgi:alpha-galactosidase